MPRELDIGWQHGKMVEGRRHQVQCNYCHRIMIGGVTRFKMHLASKKGEIKGCDAVPKEVRDIMRKHLAEGKTKRGSDKKKMSADTDVLNTCLPEYKNDGSDESDQEMTTGRLESLQIMHEEEALPPVIDDLKTDPHQQFMAGTREFFDAFSVVPSKDEQGLAPPRATDLGWAHGMMVNGDRQKIKCRYCHKVILGGGISRLKQHLAGERGNIAPCEKVPEDVKAQIQQHLGFKVLEKLKKQKETEPLNNQTQEDREAGYNDVQMIPDTTSTQFNSGRKRGKAGDEGTSRRRKRNNKLSVTMATQMSQSSLRVTFTTQESMDQADIAVAKFMYEAGIPFSAANSPYFQAIADAIAAVGPGFKIPSYHALRGTLLRKVVCEASEFCQELRKSWEVTGCTVIADRWTDKTCGTRVNFFVYCPKGTMFLKSVDASDISRNPDALVDLFDSIVQEVGCKNIINFVTDCSSCFKTAGKILMNKHKSFFWTACAANCIELMLEEIEELEIVNETIMKAKRVCRFIYNHAWVLNYIRKITGGSDLIRHAMSKSVTNFLTLQTFESLKDSLQQMFTSYAWVQSAFSKKEAGVDVTDIILDPLFWSSCSCILKVITPLLTVLHIADSEERPSLGYIYEAMENARKDIKMAFNYNESDYWQFLNVIDRIWEEQLHSPLHAAAHYLNPSIFYNPSFSTNKVIQKGLLDCIETLEPDISAQDMITKQIIFYEDAVGDFSRPVALRGRESLAPVTWWSLYASDYPDLQRLSVRILSQTCSGIRGERKQSMLERVYSNRKNQLEEERLNDLIFAHYNLNLQQRQMALGNKVLMRGAYDPICLEGVNINAADWVEDTGVLKGEDFGWRDVIVPCDSNVTLGDKVSTTDYGYIVFDSRGSVNNSENFGSQYS